MNIYDDQYYFIHRPFGQNNLPMLRADLNTGERDYLNQALPLGSAPLVFENGFKELHKKNRIPMMKTPPDILFEGFDMTVPTIIREALLEYDIPYLHMHPAVYIHDDDEWHENRWYMAFTETFNCWDKKTSKYDPDGSEGEDEEDELYNVSHYSIDKELFDKTPLEKRLLFVMGGTIDPYIVSHESLVKKVFSKGYTGVAFTKLADGIP